MGSETPLGFLLREVEFKLLDHFRIDIKKILNKVKRLVLRPLVLANLFEINLFREQIFLNTQPELSLPDLCRFYSHRVKKLFHNLDLEQQGLEEVRTAVHQQNWVVACERLVGYYHNHENTSKVERLNLAFLNHSKRDIALLCPDRILENIFIFQGHTSRVPCCWDGQLNWGWRGENKDDEWAWFLNRHYHLLRLFFAYHETRNSQYIQSLNHHLLDWITSSFSKVRQSWAHWRGREVALRALHWTVLFYSLPTSLKLTPTVRILMLSSLLDHACFLRHLHHGQANWVCREMSGLVAIASCWPEFKKFHEWLSYATQKVIKELDEQIYPDGVHKELTSHYHRIVLQDFQNISALLQLTGYPVPSLLTSRIEQMIDYLAYSISPNGRGIQNNDSDHDDNRCLIRSAAVAHKRPDWMYIASHGTTGKEPDHLSIGLPWAGQVISRSGWDECAHWSFFDIGSLGINYHVHYDKLHLSVAAYGRHLLVDSGRYCYRRDYFWKYFRQSASHNVILIDGKGQGLETREQYSPLANHYVFTPKFDFAWGQFSGSFPELKGKASHTRALIYIRNKYWVVVDYIESDRPRTIETLWHFHPDCTVKVDQESVVSTDLEVGNLRIVPAAAFSWQMQAVTGQTHPVQGWWSREYNHLVPNSTAIYSATIPAAAIFAWVLYPAVGEVPAVNVQVLSVTSDAIRIAVSELSQNTTQIAVCLGNEKAIALSRGLILKGKCAILTDGQLPLVAMGTIFDGNGSVVAGSSQASSNILTQDNRKATL